VRESRPSQTAALVATLRALANEGYTSVTGFSDPFAARLLPPVWRVVQKLASRRLRRRWGRLPAEHAGRLDSLPLRTRAIDVEVERALARGVKQLVILGAGLDSRAHRLTSLEHARVFEVDHPATQIYKRRVAAGLPRATPDLVYVTVDFERERLEERLHAAGHDASLPTVWVLEGVVMYLTDDALRATLEAVRRASAPGSTLLVNYHEPPRVEAREARMRGLFLRLVGEPQIGNRSAEAMKRGLTRAGFAVAQDTGGVDWADQFGSRFPVPAAGAVMRLAVATVEPLRAPE
jgi:methyltransferase (TIGR00027 family)